MKSKLSGAVMGTDEIQAAKKEPKRPPKGAKLVIVVMACMLLAACRYYPFVNDIRHVIMLQSCLFMSYLMVVEWNYPSARVSILQWSIIETFACMCAFNVLVATAPTAYRVANIDTFSPIGSHTYNEMLKIMKVGYVLSMVLALPFTVFAVVLFLLLNVSNL
jgi:hypothetical protein